MVNNLTPSYLSDLLTLAVLRHNKDQGYCLDPPITSLRGLKNLSAFLPLLAYGTA